MRYGPRHATNVAVMTVSTVACLGAVEAAARLAVRAMAARPFTTRGSIVRYHPLLGWDKPPGARAWLHRPEYDVLLEVNAHGLRGPDRSYEKAADVTRTLLLGDSFAEGYTVAEDRSVRAVLERELSEAGCSSPEVLNGAVMGYSTDQEYLFYVHEGHRYRPDLVIVLFYVNDLYFNTTGEQGKPWFDLEDGRLALKGSPVPPPPEGGWLRQPEVRTFRVAPWRGSIALRLLSDRTSRGNPRLHRLLAHAGLVAPTSPQPIPPELWPLYTGRKQEVEDMWRRTAAILRALGAEVERGGGRLAVFYVPQYGEVNDRAWELALDQFAAPRRFWVRDKVYRRMRHTCEELGLPFIDALPALRAAEAQGAYFPRDGHWNERGHAVAAREVARFVRQQRWLGCPP